MDVYSAPRKEFGISMAAMISLPRISRLALAAALLVATAATASELTPEQMAWYRAQIWGCRLLRLAMGGNTSR